MDDRRRAEAVDDLLRAVYPESPALRFTSPFTLLVAAILAAQCTDERVNQLTGRLFERFPDARSLATATLETIEEAVHSTGFYRQKARTLKSCCEALLERFGGEVPADVESLTSLPGIGRKTANLVLGNSFGVPGVIVDTHVKRVAYRLGLTVQTDPDRIEVDLRSLLAPARWTPFSNLLTRLGRGVCQARKPLCPKCPAQGLCPKVGVV